MNKSLLYLAIASTVVCAAPTVVEAFGTMSPAPNALNHAENVDPLHLWQTSGNALRASPTTHGDAPDGLTPSQYLDVTMDASALARQLGAGSVRIPAPLVSLPLPGGGFSVFTLEDSGTLPAELARRYPKLRSYRGQDTYGRRVRLDVDGDALRASVEDADGAWEVRPAGAQAASADSRYWSYRRDAMPVDVRSFESALLKDSQAGVPQTSSPRSALNGQVRLNFRLAVSTTTGYSRAFGGTREQTFAGVVHAVNQINDIFENDLGIHLTLAPKSDQLIQLDAASDPYRAPVETWSAVNRDLMDGIVGEANYDLGILFTDIYGGDAGSIGNTCIGEADDADLHKAAGYTGHQNPVDHPSFVLIAAHELGHKFGAHHTSNGSSRSTLDTRALEPGSGSTIMSYAGTPHGGPVQRLQDRQDSYFHASSIEQISAWTSSLGGTCAGARLNRNPTPWIVPESISRIGATPTIPARTPFVLRAHVVPASPWHELSYAWEQMDIGDWQETGGIVDDGRGPLFRSYLQDTPVRSFPRMAAMLGDEPIGPGELLPQTTRNLNFRLTVRDNQGTLATTTSAPAALRVFDTGKPFAVKTPTAAATWHKGKTHGVTWDIAGTRAAPIWCAAVTIELSINGGYDYLDEVLATNVANNGRAEVVVPELASTSRARVRVSCDNVPFFAVSPGNFTIR